MKRESLYSFARNVGEETSYFRLSVISKSKAPVYHDQEGAWGGEVCHVGYYVAAERGTERMRAAKRPRFLGGKNNSPQKLRRP
ncbi:hypothetical protein E2C01_034786 [Portunus trituberculatus]|uniref:Uncharacterized protein n=1 Tax=Portunus trituberculatus TaxID=210409 RepID=A0A5B7F7J1_PORTR|nr:hypothetical protein [Portunus trituberculatus]